MSNLTGWLKGDPVRLRDDAESFGGMLKGRRTRGLFVAFDAEFEGMAVVEFEGWFGEQRVLVSDLEYDVSTEPRKVRTPEQHRAILAVTRALERSLDVSARTGTVPTVDVGEIVDKAKQPD